MEMELVMWRVSKSENDRLSRSRIRIEDEGAAKLSKTPETRGRVGRFGQRVVEVLGKLVLVLLANGDRETMVIRRVTLLQAESIPYWGWKKIGVAGQPLVRKRLTEFRRDAQHQLQAKPLTWSLTPTLSSVMLTWSLRPPAA
jgi:hypothetical protein